MRTIYCVTLPLPPRMFSRACVDILSSFGCLVLLCNGTEPHRTKRNLTRITPLLPPSKPKHLNQQKNETDHKNEKQIDENTQNTTGRAHGPRGGRPKKNRPNDLTRWVGENHPPSRGTRTRSGGGGGGHPPGGCLTFPPSCCQNKARRKTSRTHITRRYAM
ncbi:unnamed protein product [Ectocarpus fasciculatus]